MTTEEQINKLEDRIESIEGKMGSQLELMGAMNEELKRLNRGLYGDKDNQTKGLIERQQDDEKRLLGLEIRVAEIEKAFVKDISDIKDINKIADVKKNTVKEVLVVIKEWGIVILIALLILKDTLKIDSLLDIFFKK